MTDSGKPLEWEHDKLLTLLGLLAARNGGSLSRDWQAVADAPAYLFEFDISDDGILTFTAFEARRDH